VFKKRITHPTASPGKAFGYLSPGGSRRLEVIYPIIIFESMSSAWLPINSLEYISITEPGGEIPPLRESELLPAFSGASPGCTPVSRTASGQDSAPVQTLSRDGWKTLNSSSHPPFRACGDLCFY